MRTSTIATAAVALAGFAYAGFAHSADLPVKAPVYKALSAPAPYNWSGLYGSFGAGWAREKVSWGFTNPSPADLPPFSASRSNAILSGTIGYQVQLGWLVLGAEAGLSGLVDRPFLNGPVGGGPGGCTNNSGQLCQVRISKNITTAGGKVGYAWNDWLVYGEGGAAWSQVQSRFFTPPGDLFDPVSQNRTGWYAGGGIDHVVYHWSPVDLILGVEYRHVDLGSKLVLSGDGIPDSANWRTIGAKQDSLLGRLTLKWNPRP